MVRCYEPHVSPAYPKSRTGRQRAVALTGGMRPPAPAPARTGVRRPLVVVLVLGLAIAAVVGALGARTASSSSSSSSSAWPSLVEAPTGHPGTLGRADGVVPGGVTLFDDVPAVAKLDPALLGALRRAA